MSSGTDTAPTGAPRGIERQITLPVTKALHISARSIRNRIGRTLVSMMAIFLGITFLVSTVVSNRLTATLMSEARRTQVAAAAEEEGPEAAAEAEKQRAETQQKQMWLVIIGLLVAGIGITNAMLMSVTERFREIGTMKCLGALDKFVVEILLFESAFLGLIGSAAGCVVGSIASFVMTGHRHGYGDAARAFGQNWGFFLGWCGVALLLGLALSIAAAIYPAMRAARMVPADAMRTDV